MVGPQTLNLSILVRIQVWQQKVRSSFLLPEAGTGCLRLGFEDLASIFCKKIRKVYAEILKERSDY